MLAGVTQALISEQLAGVGMTATTGPLHLTDLSRFEAAFLCNSATPACAVTAIGDHDFDARADLIERLTAAWLAAPLQTI